MNGAAQTNENISLLKIESVPQHARSNGTLQRFDRVIGRHREVTDSDLDQIERELQSALPTYFTAGPKGINCDQGRKNFFATFITEAMGKRLVEERGSQESQFKLEAVLLDIGKRVREWLGGEDFALVLYQDDWSEQRPLSTPIAFVTWNRAAKDDHGLIQAILTHVSVKEMGIKELPSFVLAGEGQAGRLELTPMTDPLDNGNMPPTMGTDWRVSARGFAVPANLIAITFNCFIFASGPTDVLLVVSAVLAFTALSLYVMGRRA